MVTDNNTLVVGFSALHSVGPARFKHPCSYAVGPTHQLSKLFLRHRTATISIHKVKYYVGGETIQDGGSTKRGRKGTTSQVKQPAIGGARA